MNDDAMQSIHRRLDAIERRLGDMEGRIQTVERGEALKRIHEAANSTETENAPRAGVFVPRFEPGPPPFLGTLPPAPAAQVSPPPPPSASPDDAPDYEYLIGGKIIPKVAAFILLLGFGFLVSIGVSRGWITPAMLFTGVELVLLAFVGVGIAKRDEREEFGQILVGVGSCGMYLNFAAGCVYQNLYGNEVLIGLFVLLSLANLAFSLWRASKTFLAIGLIGGLAAALMPIRTHDVPMNVALHLLIVAPTAFVAWRRKWPNAVVALYALATFALGPACEFSRSQASFLAAGALYGTALIAVVAYAFSYERSRFDPWGAFAFAAPLLSSLIAFYTAPGYAGIAHLLIFADILVLGSFAAPKGLTCRPAVQIAAAVIVFALAPFGLEETYWTATRRKPRKETARTARARARTNSVGSSATSPCGRRS